MKNLIENLREYDDILKSEEIKVFLKNISPSEIEEIWGLLTKKEYIKIFSNLPLEKKVDLFNLLSSTEQEKLITILSMENTKILLNEMEPDDLVDFIQSISSRVRKSVWESLSEEAKNETLFLLRFDEDEAAGLMTPRYIKIRSSISVSQAINFIRKNAGEVETVYYIYVVDQLNRLLGVLSLRDILSSDNDTKIEKIMIKTLITVREKIDQEEVARILETSDLIALPVVDSHNRMLGIITVDDVIDVIREEQTEDIYKMGAMNGTVNPYLETSIWGIVKKRIPWLILLLLVGTITTNVLKHYESIVIGASFLFIFMPVITQTGGNSGAQSSTLIIRGLATNEIHFDDIGRILLREIVIGILIGIGTGIVILIRSLFLPPNISFQPGLVIATALTFVVIFSSIIGALAPLVIHKLGFDPTVMSGPLMATVIDVCGLTIYFEIARHFILQS